MTFASRISRIWKSCRRSNRFPYWVFLALLLSGGLWQGYQYWWGVQLRKEFDGNRLGIVVRTQIFPPGWYTKTTIPYLEPLDPIKSVSLFGRVASKTRTQITAADLRLLKWLPFLKSLAIYGEIDPDVWEALAELRQLENLMVSHIPDVGSAHVAKMTRLKDLSFSLHPTNSPEAIRQIIGLPNLTKLHVGLERVPLPLRFTDLFDRTRVSPPEMLIRELAKSTTISHLELRHPSDPQLLVLCEEFPNGDLPLPSLAELRIGAEGNSITNAGLVKLKNIPNLIHVDLSQTKVDDDGVIELQSIPKLRTLYLAGCWSLSDLGAERLAEMTNLESLNIGNTRISGAGMLKLTSLKRLRLLRISSHTNPPDALRQQLPSRCKIVTR